MAARHLPKQYILPGGRRIAVLRIQAISIPNSQFPILPDKHPLTGSTKQYLQLHVITRSGRCQAAGHASARMPMTMCWSSLARVLMVCMAKVLS